jgi:hypothetical protein
MKKFALSLLFSVSAVAHAGVVATAPNQAGGFIYLTDENSGCPGQSMAYAISGFGDKEFEAYGCYIISGGSVTRKDTTGQIWTDRTGIYSMTPYGTAKTAAMRRGSM